jgi:hypothetical protein
MPRGRNVRLDHAGIGQILKAQPEIVAAIASLGERIGSAVEAHDAITRNSMPVKVEHETTDRARAVVVIASPGGLAVQAKHGVLTQAALSVGLEVTER